MQNTPNEPTHFVISVDAKSATEIDASTMRAGIEQGVNIARGEGMLTPLADETTEIGAIRVSAPSSASAALLLLLESTIATTPAARRAVEVAVATIIRQHPRDRVTILTEEERQHLLTGMAEARKTWQRNGDDDWISDVIHNGYDGYALDPDVVVIENAFCDHPIFRHLTDDASRLAVLNILAKPEVLDLIVSEDRAQPVNDLEQFDKEILRAVGPMTSAKRTSRPEDVLQALQLHGKIRQMLAERLGVDDDDEDEANTAAPRG